MTPIAQMGVHAKAGQLALQWCAACGKMQYPPRELCCFCLADALEWRVNGHAPGELLATTTLYHSLDTEFRSRLPLCVGLIRLDAGPTVVCFLPEGCATGSRVLVGADIDAADRPILTAAPC